MSAGACGMTTIRRDETPMRDSSRAVQSDGTMTAVARAAAMRLTGTIAQRATGWVMGMRATDRSWTVTTYGTRLTIGADAFVKWISRASSARASRSAASCIQA